MQLKLKQKFGFDFVPVRKVGALSSVCVLSVCSLSQSLMAADASIQSPSVDSTPIALSTAPSNPLISVDFTRAAVADILMMISQQGGVDIVIGEDVTGTLKSVHLTDKTAEQAIRTVATAAGVPWKKVDSKTYIIGRGGLSTSESSSPSSVDPGFASSNSDSAVSNPDLPPILAPVKVADALSNTSSIELRNVKPAIMAYWLDPSHQRKPIEFTQSDQRARELNDKFINPRWMTPPDSQASPAANTANTPAWAQPGSGYLPFNPYAQTQRQFGGGGGGNTGGGNNTGGGSGGNTGEDSLPSGSGTVALPAGVDNIIAIDAQNLLLVRGTDEGIDRIREIISYLDRPIPQVEIEAQFVQLSNSDINQFGISFQSTAPATTTTVPPLNGTTGGTTTDSNGFANGGINVRIVRGDVAAAITAVVNSGRGRVVNAPRVTTFNNLTAQFINSFSTTVPVPRTIFVPGSIGTTNGAITDTVFVTVSSGTVLTVIPTVNRDGTITISLQPSVTSTSLNARTPFPDLATQQINTSANIKDGDTLAIGGFRSETKNNSRGRVPFFGGIPIIGALFRSRNKTTSDTELIIFVTARVVRRIEDPVAGT